MKKLFKKSIACLIAVLMVFSSMPFTAITANAAEVKTNIDVWAASRATANTASGDRYSYKDSITEKTISGIQWGSLTHNSTYLTVNKKLLNKNKAVSSDPTWIRLIKNLAKRSKHLIAILSLFKLDHEYYIFIKYNAGLSDEGTLYKYDGKFKKVCTLDSNKIIALRKSN